MSTTTARFRDKREAILDGAARLFNQQGVKGTTVAEIARHVGLAPNSVTYYFRRKEELAAACLLRAAEAMGAAADAAARERGTTARVQAFIARYLNLLAEVEAGRHPELIVFSDLLSVPPPHATAAVAAYNELFRRVRRLLDAAGTLPQDGAARNARAHLLLSSVSWARAWLHRYEPDDYARVARVLGDILLHGLVTPGARFDAEGELPLARPGGEGAATHEAYLRAATRLVNEHGYHGASVDRIAGLLQLTKGSFYHHHQTKDELVAACFERTFGIVRAAQTAALQGGGSGLERLAMACRTLLAFQMSGQGPLLRVTAWTGLPPALRSDARRTMARLGERFTALVVDGMADGSLRIVDPSIAAQVVNGMINAAAELERWARGVAAANVFEVYALPVFTGLASGAAGATAPRTPARSQPRAAGSRSGFRAAG
jgi:AcrR family transcriptional regulator